VHLPHKRYRAKAEAVENRAEPQIFFRNRFIRRFTCRNHMHHSKLHSCVSNLALLLAFATTAPAGADPLITYPLRINTHEIRAEVAATEPDRLRGLMFRDKLAENSGMLFAYPRAEVSAMWMKNTKIALSVAFIDARGHILNIAEMEPYSEEPHASSGAAAYALEMNRGWFKKQGIKPGDFVGGLNSVPRAQ
jgi:uncharacterized membrane protein (UPF0127 family)